MRRASVWLVLAVVALAACGGGGETESADTSAPEGATAATTVTAAPLPAACPRAPFDVEIRMDGDGQNEVLTVVDATAVRRAEGRAYTVYLTDYSIDRDASLFGQLDDAPAGSVTVQTGLDVFNAEDVAALPILAAGAVGEVDWTAGETATFLNIESDRNLELGSSDSSGSAELLFVDETRLCVRADIRSQRGGQLVGVYTAEIIQDF